MKLFRAVSIALTLVSAASGYYHFLHFSSRVAPFRPVAERFDLQSLPGRVVPYFISDPATLSFAPEQSTALVSQVRSAFEVWNGVETSELQLNFSGFRGNGTNQSGPSIEVLLEGEVAPGLIAMGGPTVREANASGVAILKSVVIINPNATRRPIHSEAFFTTLVHEIGHAIGLQHTFTSGVMSTSITRATGRARPLTSDDITALSLLYPTAGFAQATGSIAGRVTMSGQGVNLASIVAISNSGAAVSTLTNPDGTYRIDGLPPRTYYVYVHPLPPPRPGQSSPGDIVYPVDGDGRSISDTSTFETVFYSPSSVFGTREWVQSAPLPIVAGQTAENINFFVRSRAGHTIHSVETFAYPANTAVKPPYLYAGMARPFLAATGPNLTANATVSVLGGATLPIRPFPTAPDTYVQIDFSQQMLMVSTDTQRHLVFNTGNDIYVLPSAFFHVGQEPPRIGAVSSVLEGTTRIATIQAAGVNQDTRILFDGVPAQIRSFEVLPNGGGTRITAVAPQAPPQHRAVVTAVNSDGQSSLALQSDSPALMAWGGEGQIAASSPIQVTPNLIPSGAETVLQIDVPGAQFVDRQVSVGFGSTDVAVRQVWVVSPTRLLVTVTVSPAAAPTVLPVTIISGLQTLNANFTLSLPGPQPRTFWLSSQYSNAVTGGTSVSAGSQVTITAASTPVVLTQNNVSVFLNDTRIPSPAVSGNQITFTVPQGTPQGFALVRVEALGERSLPMLLHIDAQSARILAVTAGTPEPRPGDLILISIAGLGSAAEKAVITVGGRDTQVIDLFPDGERHTLVVRIPEETLRGSTVPVLVHVADAPSEPFQLRVGI